MKKVFLLAAVAFATSVNAQVVQFDAEAMGLTSSVSAVTAGTSLGTNAALDAYIAFDDSYKAANIKNDDYNVVKIGSAEILTKGGMQGNTNPTDADGTNPANSLAAPNKGCAYGFDAKADGIVYVVAKLSSNKQYVVFEDGAPIGYKAAMEIVDKDFPNNILSVEVKGEGEYNVVKESIAKLAVIALNNAEATSAQSAVNGLGVVWFPVAKDSKYLFMATGSKASVSGLYFTTAEEDVVVEGTDSDAPKDAFKIYSADPTGIANVAAAKAENARMFNLAGQEVSKNFKGIVVVNGKKFMNK